MSARWLSCLRWWLSCLRWHMPVTRNQAARITEDTAAALFGEIDHLQVAIAAMCEKEFGEDCAPPLVLSTHAKETLAEARRRAAQLDELDRQRDLPRHGMRLVRRSAARLPVASPCPRRNRGRWCHAGPSQATGADRHPGSRRVLTVSTLAVPTRNMVP